MSNSDEHNPDQSERNSVQDVNISALPVWHRPEISRISIKRTLIGSGSAVDGTAGSS
jgi:hypothetical protein